MMLEAKNKGAKQSPIGAVWSVPLLFALAEQGRHEISLFQIAPVAGHAGLSLTWLNTTEFALC